MLKIGDSVFLYTGVKNLTVPIIKRPSLIENHEANGELKLLSLHVAYYHNDILSTSSVVSLECISCDCRVATVDFNRFEMIQTHKKSSK